MDQESNQSKKKLEIDLLLKSKDSDINGRIMMVRSRIEHCNKELSSFGENVLS